MWTGFGRRGEGNVSVRESSVETWELPAGFRAWHRCRVWVCAAPQRGGPPGGLRVLLPRAEDGLLRPQRDWAPGSQPFLLRGRRRCLVQLVVSCRQSAWGPAPSCPQGYRAGLRRKVTGGWSGLMAAATGAETVAGPLGSCPVPPCPASAVSNRAALFISLCLVTWLFLTCSKLRWGEGWVHRCGR